MVLTDVSIHKKINSDLSILVLQATKCGGGNLKGLGEFLVRIILKVTFRLPLKSA